MRIAFNTLFSTESTLSSIKTFFSDLDVDFVLSENSDTELSLLPLHLLPIQGKTDAILALLPMSERSNFLVIRKDVYNVEDRIGLESNAIISTSKMFVQNALLAIRKDLKFKVIENTKIIENVRKGAEARAIIEGSFISSEVTDNYHIVRLDEREFGHYPGQGYLALTGPSEYNFRKLLRKHTKENHVVTCNIERKMSDLYVGRINNHCEIDANGNIHVWAFGEDSKTHFSQSTRLNIEEKVIEKMQSLI